MSQHPAPPSPAPLPRPPGRGRRLTAAALTLTATGGIATAVATGLTHWGLIAIPILTVAGITTLAAVVFASCAVLGINPGPAGDRLAELVKDLLRSSHPR